MSDINIVFTRVDNRLVHGQVGNVWVTASGANLILVVDDETSRILSTASRIVFSAVS